MSNNPLAKERTTFSFPIILPVLPIRDVVVFPYMVLPLAVGREKSVRALESAIESGRLIFLVTQQQIGTEDPQQEDIYKVGIVAEILQMLKMPDGTLKILVEGLRRGRISEMRLLPDKKYLEAKLEDSEEAVEPGPELEAFQRQVAELFEQYVKLNRRIPFEISLSLNNIGDPGHFADTVSSHLLIKIPDKQQLLELGNPRLRLEKLMEILRKEIDILNIERRIQNRVRGQIEKTQKEFYLTEQMKAIQKELRQKDDYLRELDELRNKIKSAKMSTEATEAAEKELKRLEKMMPVSPEATVSRTYLDWLINLPWSVFTRDNLDIKRAQKILDTDHYGLEKAKERIIEYLAVIKRVKKIKGQILCFVGPPGVGKTSLARSIARALGRNFVRISLGGVRDEAEIRGHRRTYIGSLPGRIIQSMRKVKAKNPVFLLDEVDKMGTDWRGDPAAALLEVLDPEQNHSFVDHYLDVEFDLSEVMFITTANTLFSIPPSLQDRLEIIRFPGYTNYEKLMIARQFLFPKQLEEHGLKKEDLLVSDAVLERMINEYTREAGVRNMEREIANLARKVAKELVLNSRRKNLQIKPEDLEKYLGVPKFFREKIDPNDVGVATGLAWTEHGGELLAIEVVMIPGKGKLVLTGKLGEVMQESAQAALSYVRSASKDLLGKEKLSFYRYDFHIHIPEGAVPKDGPSAGAAIALALASTLSKRPVKKGVALTGELTLRGRILPIGGFKEKVLAAYREGMNTVIYPEGNRKDLEDIPQDIQKKIRLIPVKHLDDVLNLGLGKVSPTRVKKNKRLDN